jgi:hypothetical protein
MDRSYQRVLLVVIKAIKAAAMKVSTIILALYIRKSMYAKS